MPSAKKIFLFLGILITLYSIYIFFTNTDNIGPKVASVSTTNTNDIVPGELIVKLKEPIEELALQNTTATGKLKQQSTPLNFVSLKKDRLPQKLQEIHTKYGIKTVEKVFHRSQSPDKELARIKQQFKAEIESNTRKIDEDAIIKNDLSTIYLVKVGTEVPIVDVVAELNADPGVEYAEPNYIANLAFIPNDPYFPVLSNRLNQWGLENPGKTTGTITKIDADIDATIAWDVELGYPGLLVAVIDTGIDYTHPDLGGGIGAGYKIVGGYDFVNLDSDPMDDNGHGTHVAGIVAATANNGIGISGVCPSCRLLAIKTHSANGPGTYSNGALGVTFAVENYARVINISWGGYYDSPTLRTAIANAVAQNVVVVAAAGNDNISDPFYPTNYPGVIGVANLNEQDKKQERSNYDDGSGWIDISAPGSSILSTILPGGKSCNGSLHESGDTRYGYCTGTSMASPIVAGVAGLVLSKDRNLTVPQVITRIITNADSLNTSGDFQYIGKLGAGRVNAYRALTSLASPVVTCEHGSCLNWCFQSINPPPGFKSSNVAPLGGYVPLNGSGSTSSGIKPLSEAGVYMPLSGTGSSGSVYKSGPVTFTWNAQTGATGYHVRIDYAYNGWRGDPWYSPLGCADPYVGDSCLNTSQPTVTLNLPAGSVTKYNIKIFTNNGCLGQFNVHSNGD